MTHNAFCIDTVGRLLEGRQCEIFNTDQGVQFTTTRFTQPLLDKGVKVSMDGVVERWTTFLSKG